MIIDITNEILTKLKTDLVGIEVVTSNQDTEQFPRVVFTENLNSTHIESIDSSGETKNEIVFDINIYTVGDRKMSDAKSIRNQVDSIMSDFYNMNRVYSNNVPNYFDQSIYRYVLRYNCVVDSNEVVYRR